MMGGRAGHRQGLARGGIPGDFLDGVRRPSGRSVTGHRDCGPPESQLISLTSSIRVM